MLDRNNSRNQQIKGRCEFEPAPSPQPRDESETKTNRPEEDDFDDDEDDDAPTPVNEMTSDEWSTCTSTCRDDQQVQLRPDRIRTPVVQMRQLANSKRSSSPMHCNCLYQRYGGCCGDGTMPGGCDCMPMPPPTCCDVPMCHCGGGGYGRRHCVDWNAAAYGRRASFGCKCCCNQSPRFNCLEACASHHHADQRLSYPPASNYYYCRSRKAPIQSGGGSYDELQDRLHRLHGEKENLMLQVSVLSEQVEAQVEKMRELESVLEEKRGQLDSTEELCRLEMLSRSGLMGEVEHLRARLSSVEQDKKDLVERLKKLQAENAVACEKTNERENELLALKSVLARNGTISAVTDYITEIEKLKKRLDELVASNEEKDKTIEELALVVSRQKRIQEWIPSERRVSDPPPLPERTNENTSSPQPYDSSKVLEKPPPVPRTSLPSCSTPLSSPPGWSENRSSPSLSQISLRSFQKSGSAENIVTPSNASTGSRTPPAKRHYSTLPRPHGAQVLQQIQQQLQQHHRAAESSPDGAIVHSTNINTSPSHSYHSLHNSSLDAFRSTRSNKPPAVSFGKVLFGLKTGKRSTSAPQLAQPEIVPLPLENDSNTLPHDSMSSQKDKNKGIKKIWGKLRRSGSHTMDLKQAEFKRGGIRATAGPRLGWSQEAKNETQGVPVSQWNNEKIIDWLNKMGLGVYVGECKKWGKGGSHLHKASARDLEEWLGMKNPLHRKKVLLALQAAGDSLKGDSLGMAASRLDHHWVVRWLDDVGLPQYKDAFLDARVDGNLLHFLTVEDLIALKVTNLLHHISIKQGIQVLRQKRFDPFCLKRRSIPDETTSYAPADVVLWTNHRVMEWLRTVDLSEYAPNLRGSGVHGALIAYEPRFNAELMASLLNIPPNKTLLRRHLSTQFKQLVGTDLMMEKRDCQTQATFVPLTPNTKVKAVHRGQFSLIKKRVKGEVELEEFVCSMDPPPQLPLPNHRNAEKTAEEIGTVSKDISQLADKLQNEQLLATMAATNV